MRKKQEEFYKIYHKLGRTEEAAEIALGKVYSVKTWSKANRKKQLDKLLFSDDGKLYLDSLEKTKKVRKKLEKTNSDLDKSLEKTTSNGFGKKKVGRKTLYTEQADIIAREILALGGHDVDVQAALGISERTYYRWKIDVPSFYNSVMAGKRFYGSTMVEKSLLEKACGGYMVEEVTVKENEKGTVIERVIKTREQPKDTSALKYWLDRMMPEEWGENKENGGGDLAGALKELAEGLPD